MLKLISFYWLFLLLPSFWKDFDPVSEYLKSATWRTSCLLGADNVFGLNVPMEKICPLVIPLEFTSVSPWGITPKPSAPPLFARGFGSRGEWDRERVSWKIFLWPFGMLRGTRFSWCLRSTEETFLFRLKWRWKPSFGALHRDTWFSFPCKLKKKIRKHLRTYRYKKFWTFLSQPQKAKYLRWYLCEISTHVKPHVWKIANSSWF